MFILQIVVFTLTRFVKIRPTLDPNMQYRWTFWWVFNLALFLCATNLFYSHDNHLSHTQTQYLVRERWLTRQKGMDGSCASTPEWKLLINRWTALPLFLCHTRTDSLAVRLHFTNRWRHWLRRSITESQMNSCHPRDRYNRDVASRPSALPKTSRKVATEVFFRFLIH